MRAFLAIELPESVRRCLAEVQRALAPGASGWRWVKPEGLHLTLRFLGEVADDAVAKAIAHWRDAGAAAARFTIRVAGLGAFPSVRRPRVIWAGVVEEPPAGRLTTLAASFEAASVAAGLGAADRPFTPHLTLARAVAKPGRMPRTPAAVDCGPAPVSEIVLFRSELRPQGALHTPLDRFVLGGDDGCL